MTATIDEDTYAELWLAVDAGAEFMDAIDADWYWIVDPERLDMSYASAGAGAARDCACILAQHNPSHWFEPGDYGVDDDTASAFGFATDMPNYPMLTDLWREQIWDRRAAYFERAEQAS